MKQIYFSNQNESFIKKGFKSVLSYSTSALDRTLPALSMAWAEKVLCTPSKPKNPVSLVDLGFQQQTLLVYGHDIQVYTRGDLSKALLFIHGWSGAAENFQSFFEPALNAEYGIIVFDHAAHGSSSGKTANFFVFVRAIQSVMSWAKTHSIEIKGIVSHSMGASALISSLTESEKSVPLVLIAPVIPFFESLYNSVESFGVTRNWVARLVKTFELRYEMNAESIDPKIRIQNLYNPLQIIHDKQDTFSALETNKPLIPERYSKIVETTGLGHFRILKSPQTVETAVHFISNARN